MSDLVLTVTIDEANAILEGLGTLPYAKVYALVDKIQVQATQQLQESKTTQAKNGLASATSSGAVSAASASSAAASSVAVEE